MSKKDNESEKQAEEKVDQAGTKNPEKPAVKSTDIRNAHASGDGSMGLMEDELEDPGPGRE
jgi:hypothetical protein